MNAKRKKARRAKSGASLRKQVTIPGPMWDRVEALIEDDPQFAGTAPTVGRATIILLNERLLEREAALRLKGEAS